MKKKKSGKLKRQQQQPRVIVVRAHRSNYAQQLPSFYWQLPIRLSTLLGLVSGVRDRSMNDKALLLYFLYVNFYFLLYGNSRGKERVVN